MKRQNMKKIEFEEIKNEKKKKNLSENINSINKFKMK